MSASSCVASNPASLVEPFAFGDFKSFDGHKMDCTYSIDLNEPKNLYLSHELRQLLSLLQQQQSNSSTITTTTTGSSGGGDPSLLHRLENIPLQYSTAPAPIQIDISGLSLLLSSLIGGTCQPEPLYSTSLVNSTDTPCSALSNGASSTGGIHPKTVLTPPSSVNSHIPLDPQKSTVTTPKKGTSGEKASHTETPPKTKCEKLSSNLLHQLLSGVDATQVRHRSGLIEHNSNNSNLTTPMKCESRDDVSSTHDSTSYGKVSPSIGSESGRVSTETSVTLEDSEWNTRQDLTQSSSPRLLSQPTPPPNFQLPAGNQVGVIGTSPLSILLAERLWALLQRTSTVHTVTSSPPASTTSPVALSISVSTPTVNELCSTNRPVSSSPPVLSSPGLRRLLCQTSVITTPPSPKDPNQMLAHSAHSNRQPASAESLSRQHSNTDRGGVSFVKCAPTLSVESSLPEPQKNRPRSHSDAHNGMRTYSKAQHYHRPRSYSKLDAPMVHHRGEPDTENLNQELQSSLFARLVLTTDSSPPPPPSPPTTNDEQTNRRVVSPALSPAPQPMVLDEASSNPNPSENTILTCDSATRNRVFEWLREADLFVAEHCRDIPLGALLAVSISPCRTNGVDLYSSIILSSPISTDGIPSSSKRILSKIWHQLLLISMIENNFTSLRVCMRSATTTRATTIQNGPTSSSPSASNGIRQNPTAEHEKWLNAISALMELQLDDAPPPDQHLVKELTGVIATGGALNLSSKVYKAIRFCLLAQNAYPHHFSTSYPEALSELEAELTRNPGTEKGSSFTEVLKMLNRLHCFDAGTLKQFFSLSTDPAIQDQTTVPIPSRCPTQQLHSPVFSTFTSTCSGPDSSLTSGTFKRKARTHRSSDHELSPVRMRSRAYTTNSYNKSVRLSEKLTATAKGDSVPNHDHP
ncbi:hypothetical protein CRM22_010958 [Opisthorchis felineus]|uniref:Uncharacterized protein n=1 Tax=Opisthorchis felineus TaxID=147828 RepID=A0A4S2KH83_OPIFE|nr:hypothetical protein CRM22_010958 [Opisthorchis felineus]